MVLQSGIYTITNVRTQTIAGIADDSDKTDVVLSYGDDKGISHKWVITKVANKSYVVRSQRYGSIAKCDYRPKDGDVIYGWNTGEVHFYWKIVAIGGRDKYIINEIDGQLCWRADGESHRSPVKLGVPTDDSRNIWHIQPVPSGPQTMAPIIRVAKELDPVLTVLYRIYAELDHVEVDIHQCTFLVSRARVVFDAVNDTFDTKRAPRGNLQSNDENFMQKCFAFLKGNNHQSMTKNANHNKEFLRSFAHKLSEIKEFLQYMSSLNLLTSLLKHEHILDRFREIHQLLNQIADDSQINVKLVEQDFQNAQTKDEQSLHNLLNQMNNQDPKSLENYVLHAFHIRSATSREAKEAMVAMRHYIDSHDCQSLACQFFICSISVFEKASSLSSSDKLPKWAISRLELVIDESCKLGSGGFGVVKKGTWNGISVAIKFFTAETSPGELQKEIKLWKNLRHDNILQFYGASVNANPPFIVSRFMKNGSLSQYLHHHSNVPKPPLVYGIYLGMLYLHSKDIVHGDLKPVNVLIDDTGNSCIADFGLSQIRANATSKAIVTVKNVMGTLRYMSPEHMKGKLGKPSDVYSFAMTTYEVFTGAAPFLYIPDANLGYMIGDKFTRLDRPEDSVDNQVWSIIWKCSMPKSTDRPTFINLEPDIQPLGLNSQNSKATGLELDTGIDPEDEVTKVEDSIQEIHQTSSSGPTSSQTISTSKPFGNLSNSGALTGVNSWLDLANTISNSGQPHIDFDYTPKWTSVPWGRPGDFYINDVTFPKVLRDKPYKYHVFKGDEDLGVREPYEIRSDGSQTVNILEYHRGYGILETNPIVIYLLDPDTEVEYKLTEWQKK